MRAAVLLLVVACSSAAGPPPNAPEPKTPEPVQEGSGAPTWIGVLFEKGTTRVRQVMPTSPAEVAKIADGDEFISVAGTAVTDSAQVAPVVMQHRAGERIDVVLRRAGQELTIPITVALRPEAVEIQRTKLGDRPAPDFVLPALDGGTDVRLADFRGKVVVLDFWAPWCAPCVASMPQLDAWHRQLGPQGLVIIGITSEDPAEVRDFVRDHKLGYHMALDHDNDLWRDYLVQGIPTTVIVDKGGVVRYVELGFAGDFSEAEVKIKALLTSRTSH